MSSARRFRSLISAVALALAVAGATFGATPAQAVGPAMSAQALPITAGAEEAAASPKTDLVVLYQGSKTYFYGTEMRYTVANASSFSAQSVSVTKTVKTTGNLNALATPVGEQLGSLAPGEWREVVIVCGATLQASCQGSTLTAKTSTPEVTTANNTASVSF